MYDKAVSTYASTINLFSECIMIQEMCDKEVNVFLFDSIPDQYKIHKMCDRVSSEDLFLIVHCPNKYKTQRMCDVALDDPLAALQLIPDWVVPSKMIKILFIALYADENIL